MTASNHAKTAAIILIGDEILTGKTQDKNGYYASLRLFEHGVELHEVIVIPDVKEKIVDTVLRVKDEVDYVFTSGGIGSTHDDITYLSIAEAFKRGLKLNESYASEMIHEIGKKRGLPTLAELIKERSPLLKMATFPQPSELIITPNMWVPLIRVENVYIFPGIPSLFRPMFDNLLLSIPSQKKTRRLLYTDRVEGQFAQHLEIIQKNNNDVAIGSYPRAPGGAYRVKISIEGYQAEAVVLASNQVANMLTDLGGWVTAEEPSS